MKKSRGFSEHKKKKVGDLTMSKTFWICEDCAKEKRSLKDADTECLHCDKHLCGGHVMKHLQEKHCVGTHIYEVVKE